MKYGKDDERIKPINFYLRQLMRKNSKIMLKYATQQKIIPGFNALNFRKNDLLVLVKWPMLLKRETPLIRFWEKAFDVLKPKKNARAIENLHHPGQLKTLLIYAFGKERGFTLEGAKTI